MPDDNALAMLQQEIDRLQSAIKRYALATGWDIDGLLADLAEETEKVDRLTTREATLRRVCEEQRARLDRSWPKEVVEAAWESLCSDYAHCPPFTFSDFAECVERGQAGA